MTNAHQPGKPGRREFRFYADEFQFPRNILHHSPERVPRISFSVFHNRSDHQADLFKAENTNSRTALTAPTPLIGETFGASPPAITQSE